jgi:hypothetical protein
MQAMRPWRATEAPFRVYLEMTYVLIVVRIQPLLRLQVLFARTEANDAEMPPRHLFRIHFVVNLGRELPEWASVNLGILLCIDCCGVHRSLGALRFIQMFDLLIVLISKSSCRVGSDISRTRSLLLDKWGDKLIQVQNMPLLANQPRDDILFVWDVVY